MSRHLLNLSRWLELELAPRDAETVAAMIAELRPHRQCEAEADPDDEHHDKGDDEPEDGHGLPDERQQIPEHHDDQRNADHGDLQNALEFGADRETIDQPQADQHHDNDEEQSERGFHRHRDYL